MTILICSGRRRLSQRPSEAFANSMLVDILYAGDTTLLGVNARLVEELAFGSSSLPEV